MVENCERGMADKKSASFLPLTIQQRDRTKS
jgi:hypothetical protein